MKRIGKARRKTRNILKKPQGQKGKVSLTKFLQKFDKGDKVLMKAEPAVQTGQYYRRFHGKVGKIEEKQGDCYKVSIKDGGKAKTVIVHPIHLRKH